MQSLSSQKRLALAICDFLSTSISDGTLAADERENIEVAVNCIGEAFGIDPNDKSAVANAIGSQSLKQIYSVYEKLKNASGASSSTATRAVGATSSSSSSAPANELTEEKQKQADALKSKGNAALQHKEYATAINLYTQALAIDPSNAVYLSNRAAAYSQSEDHDSARQDAEAAVALDPDYTKAWSRLGLARLNLGDAKGAMDAYKQGIEHEGNGGSEVMRKGFETAKRRVEGLEEEADSGRDVDPGARDVSSATPLADLAGMFGGGSGRGGAGGGGGGGMPDFTSIMNNPMFSNMAQGLMNNPEMLNGLMNNPSLREMANQFRGRGNVGDTIDVASLLSDPNITELARSMMGGGAGRGGAGGSGGAGQ